MTGSNEFEKEEYLLLMISGFSDQSHFTNFFNKFIGLSPRVYRDIFMKNTDKGGSHNGKE
jgi:AraC-like DNA-binding protein